MGNADTARRIAYTIIALGVALAFAGSIVPFFDASYRLSTSLLIFQLVPYVVYSALTIQRNGYAIALPGIFIIAVDLYAHVYQWTVSPPSDSLLYAYMPIWLTVIVLPIGWGLGALLGKGSLEDGGEQEEPQAGEQAAGGGQDEQP